MGNQKLFNQLDWLWNNRAHLKQFEIELVEDCFEQLSKRTYIDADKWTYIQELVKRVQNAMEAAVNRYHHNSFKTGSKDRYGRYYNQYALSQGGS